MITLMEELCCQDKGSKISIARLKKYIIRGQVNSKLKEKSIKKKSLITKQYWKDLKSFEAKD